MIARERASYTETELSFNRGKRGSSDICAHLSDLPFDSAHPFDRLRMTLSGVEWVRTLSLPAVSSSNPSKRRLEISGAALSSL